MRRRMHIHVRLGLIHGEGHTITRLDEESPTQCTADPMNRLAQFARRKLNAAKRHGRDVVSRKAV